jgi:hypothetical protein
MRNSFRHLMFTALAAAVALTPDDALAAPSEPSKPTPHFVALSLGVAVGLSDLARTQFDIAQSYNYHVLGTSDGPFVGIELQEGMGHYFRFGAGVRAGWDWRPVADLPLYLAPEVRLGLASTEGELGFNLRLGAEVRYRVAQNIFAILRPVGVNLALGDFAITSYDILGGLGYAF